MKKSSKLFGNIKLNAIYAGPSHQLEGPPRHIRPDHPIILSNLTNCPITINIEQILLWILSRPIIILIKWQLPIKCIEDNIPVILTVYHAYIVNCHPYSATCVRR